MSSTSDTVVNPEQDTVSVSSLRAGMRLAQGIYAESGVLLLAAGTEVTPRFLQRLGERQITVVTLRTRQVAEELESACEDKINQLLDSRPRQSTPSCADIDVKPQVRLSVDDLTAEAKAGLGKHAAASAEVADVGAALAAEKTASAAEIESQISDFANMVALDKDLLSTIVAIQAPQHEYLFDHCVNTAVLAMTLGAQLGWPHERIIELGTGALLADVGMLRVPVAIRLAQCTLTSWERSEIERHPFHTFDCLERLQGFPTVASFVGYQIHERLDGSGYPQNRSGFFIHEYARIAAVADTYSARTHSRPHRPPLLPYLAVKEILAACGQGKFEPSVVRALLDSVGLFPIRSFVELNNGAQGVVIRTNPGSYTRPVVAGCDQDGEPAGEVIDLSKETGLNVVRALDPCDLT